MKKYLVLFRLSLANEFTYRLNFLIWRARNVLRVLMVFFLWKIIFTQQNMAFGYSSEQMNVYILLSMVILAFVWSAPSNDLVGGQIADGQLSNFLLKPIDYLKY